LQSSETVRVPRAEHATTQLQAGDLLEIVHFVGGG
jgi:thiamine biosynthesis protein ThiS